MRAVYIKIETEVAKYFLFCFNMGIRGWGGGGTLIFSYIRRLGPLWKVQKFSNFNIFGGFQKNEYFGGMKIL